MPTTRTLRTTYPCCGGQSRLSAHTEIPRESYMRICPQCHTTYLVERRTLQQPIAAGIIIDQLDWTDTATWLYIRKYGDTRHG
jgi:hypothetical protein